MPFAVIWLKDRKVLGATPRADLQSAKKHALEYFPIKRQQDGATSVEVRDDNGNPVFKVPGGNHA